MHTRNLPDFVELSILNKKAYEDLTKVDAYMQKGLAKCEREIFQRYLANSDTVLDVGCYVGRVSFSLHSMVKQIIGIDVSESGILIAEEFAKNHNITNCKFMNCSATNIPIDRESFSVALIPYNGFEDIPGRSQRLRALLEINKVLKSRGILILSVHNKFYFRRCRTLLISNGLRILSRMNYALSLRLGSILFNEEKAKILLSAEMDSVVWREPDSKSYLSHYFYSLSKLRYELKNSNFTIKEVIPIEDYNPHDKDGLSKGILNKKKKKLLFIPSYYVIAEKIQNIQHIQKS